MHLTQSQTVKSAYAQQLFHVWIHIDRVRVFPNAVSRSFAICAAPGDTSVPKFTRKIDASG